MPSIETSATTGSLPMATSGNATQTGLFSNVLFSIILSNDLDEDTAQDLSTLLQKHGAVEASNPSTNGESTTATHLISSTIHFQYYEQAVDRMISIVKPSWIEASLEKKKIANPRSHSPDPRLFFSGVVVHIADLPENDKNAIIGGVEAMGGIYAAAISRQVTHIVALNEEPQACQIARTKKLAVKIVLPHWFDDCLRLGRKISEDPYLLPNPTVLEPYSTVPKADPNAQLIGLSATPDDLGDLDSTTVKVVFKDHRVKLSDDLGISIHLYEAIVSIVETGGGKCVSDISEADTLICQYREGSDFQQAGAMDITIGNLSWLYHIILTDSWSLPTRRLLHFPIARKGLSGFKNYRISLSNYNGDARLYLENLAKAAGCAFTKSMKADNTHLITAHTLSEKCDAAREWSIHMINHLWLEDSYAKWAVQSVSTPKYTHFPVGTNLSDVVGQTPIDRQALEKHFFSPPEEPAAISTPKTETVMGKPTKVSRTSSIDTTPAIPASSPGLSTRKRDNNSTPAPSSKSRKSGLSKEIVTPAPNSAGKENETPPTSGRSSKMQAMVNMSGLAQDLALYEKEKKRKGGVTHGGRSSEDQLPPPSTKRDRSEVGTDSEERISKKARKVYPEPVMTLLVTGYGTWSEDPIAFAKDSDQLAQLGIKLAEDAKDCQYLVAPKIMRTKKFICAVATAPILLRIEFVAACLEQNKLVDPKDYPLVDPVGEKRYGGTLKDMIKRAKQNKGQLLAGQTLYVTPDIRGGPATYIEICEANGGKCVVFKGRTTSLSRENEDEGMPDADTPLYLVSKDTKSEKALWHKFREQAEAAGYLPRIVTTDFLLDLALLQNIRYNKKYVVDENV